MSIRVLNLRLAVTEPEERIPDLIAGRAGIPRDEIAGWRVLRKSLDCRDKRDIAFVYAIELRFADAECRRRALARTATRGLTIEEFQQPHFARPPFGIRPLKHRPVIVGSGPAGMVAAYFLASWGFHPLVIERGNAVRDRIRDVRDFEAGKPLNPESNYLFGEGGAGTFSDGKLTCRSTGPEVDRVLQLFVECKGRESLRYEHRPHLGSNRLPAVVKSIRQKTIATGGQFLFNTKMEDLLVQNGAVSGVATSAGNFAAEAVILAIGHSARDTYAMLHARGIPMEQKPFQFGLRIEQPQVIVDRHQYGMTEHERILGAADYSVVVRGEPSVFSFCMCAGGQVIPSVSEPSFYATNGMSLSDRASLYANSGMMITLEPGQFGSSSPLAGIELQRKFEQIAFQLGKGEYLAPIQWSVDFIKDKKSSGAIPSSHKRGVVSASLHEIVPPLVAKGLVKALPVVNYRWQGKFLKESTLVGPESRGSSPVRFPRHVDSMQSTTVAGLYPIGEGAGFAGGIVSAAIDGLRCAMSICRNFAPFHAE